MEQDNVDSAKNYVVEVLIYANFSAACQVADPDLCVYTGLSRSGAIRGLESTRNAYTLFGAAIPVESFNLR
jgi:hypothetical protein